VRHLPARQQGPVESRLLRAEIARAQRIVEDEGYQIRQTLFAYSDLVERQRQAIHRWRTGALERTAAPHLLAERSPERHARLLSEVGARVLADVERRLTQLVIDRCWSDYLAEVREMREDVLLLSFAGKFPLAEFHREVGRTFLALEQRIEGEIVSAFEALAIGPRGVDWDRAGLRGPAATWTYLVGENPFGVSGLLSPAGRTGMGLAAAGVPWLLLLQGLSELMKRRRGREKGEEPR
jgi:preprotein translocase subunit SecA